jgi:hypothetical protein
MMAHRAWATKEATGPGATSAAAGRSGRCKDPGVAQAKPAGRPRRRDWGRDSFACEGKPGGSTGHSAVTCDGFTSR